MAARPRALAAGCLALALSLACACAQLLGIEEASLKHDAGGTGTGGMVSGGSGGRGAGSGGAPGTGGACTVPMGTSPYCPRRCEEVLSDFTAGNPAKSNVEGGFPGWWWFTVYEGAAPPEPPNPGTLTPRKDDAAGIPRDTTTGGPCSGPGSLRQAAAGVTGWGVAIAVSLAMDQMVATAAGTQAKHGYYDASRYAGVRAWMKCTNEVTEVAMMVLDGNTDFDAPAPTCASYASCTPFGTWNNTVDTTWKLLTVDFASAIQEPDRTGATVVPAIDKARLTMLQVQVQTRWNQTTMTGDPNNFDCWIDDVHFY
jgi:hypothetical protein